MPEEEEVKTRRIENVTIEHNGDVENGLKYLDYNWKDPYVLQAFSFARNSSNHTGYFIAYGNHYILKHLRGDRFSLAAQ